MENTGFKSTKEFFDLWTKDYESFCNKLVEMPAIGPMREKSEKMMKGFPIFSNLYSSWMDSNAKLQNVFIEAMQKTYEKTAEEMKGDVGPEKYKKFYRIWMETYSETYKKFLNSENFTTDWGKFMSASLDSQKFNREMLEEYYLKPMNMPTKTEIDDLVKEVYSLKKKVKELNKQINHQTQNK